jgi:hypothetical protein
VAETKQKNQKNLVERLADVGEDALQRLGSAPGGDKVVNAVNSMRDRLDELQKRVRGLEELEKRLKAVEWRLDKLEGKGKPKPPARKTSTTSRKGSSA